MTDRFLFNLRNLYKFPLKEIPTDSETKIRPFAQTMKILETEN